MVLIELKKLSELKIYLILILNMLIIFYKL